MPRWLGFLIILSMFVVVWGGVHAYLYWRVAYGFELGSRERLTLKLVLLVLAAVYLAGRGLERTVGQTVGMPVMWVGAIWMGAVSITFCTLLAFDLWVALPTWILQRAGAVRAPTAAMILKWGMAASLVVSAALTGWGSYVALKGPRVTELRIPLKGLPASAEGFSLVAISDIHVGDVMTQRYLDGLTARIEGMKPDLLVVIGDITDEAGGGDGTTFRKLAAVGAKHGVFAATGNHEWYSGGEGVVDALQGAGVRVLRQNREVVAGAIELAGVDDPTFLGGRNGAAAAIDRALAGRASGLPVVLIAHQPVGVEHAAKSGVGLMLCGHTHGGQLPPFQFLTGLAFPYFAGSYEVEGMHLYVNNGAGSWGPPVRLFAEPEIVRVTLTPGE